MDVKVLDANQNEVDLKQHFDDDDDTYLPSEETEHMSGGVVDESELERNGFSESEEEDGYDSDDEGEEYGDFADDYGDSDSDEDGEIDEDEDEDDYDDESLNISDLIDGVFDNKDSEDTDSEEQF